jgi:hypothetical protein
MTCYRRLGHGIVVITGETVDREGSILGKPITGRPDKAGEIIESESRPGISDGSYGRRGRLPDCATRRSIS